ncbi:ZIP family metal transporter [Aquabacterium sp. CECT 9606]|uniref:ZIP family metal transporter n=1 Tax=Aquabacterium sp. CECT 9606 TaxID=2845822 RepID=UPI001E3EC1C3|nr:hypothetical protein [Aquabacterium sp. CECT 9606]CAH0353431.1 hypothetical protein AQB9606_03227 [Aquabacterium sp. CECT 9606]
MSAAILQVFLFTLPAFGIATVGAVIAALRPPTDKVTSLIQHFAAGIVFAATALELLPKERTQSPLPVVIGFALGLALMLLVRQVAGTIEKREQASRYPYGLLLVTAIDLVIDGLVLGMAFSSGEKTGILIAAALTLEVLFLALAISGAMSKAGIGRAQTMMVPPALALLLTVSAMAGRMLFAGLGTFPFTVFLGIGTVALLYLVTEELLVEAHEVEETSWAVSAFFAGFLLFLVIEMLVEA